MDHLLNLLFICAITATGVAFCCGLALLLFPGHFRSAAAVLDRWYSATPLFEVLDKPRYIERWVYGRHRFSGTAIVLGTGYTLVALAGLHAHAAAVLLPESLGAGLKYACAQSAWVAILASNVVALILGLTVFFRPSLLKRTERTANRWLSTAEFSRALDVPHAGPDGWLWLHPRLAGFGMMAVAIYIGGVLATCHYRLW